MQSQADEILGRVGARIEESARAQLVGLRPTYRLMIASRDGELLGFSSMSAIDSGLMGPTRTVLVDAIHVLQSARKSGAGTALMRSSIEFADAIGADEINVVVGASREDNRFFARSGFGPVSSRRVANVDVLRRAWGLDTKLNPKSGQLSDAERQRRRRVLLKPRVGRRPSRTPIV
jgi:GNAT superfamily N-acetyltransferase